MAGWDLLGNDDTWVSEASKEVEVPSKEKLVEQHPRLRDEVITSLLANIETSISDAKGRYEQGLEIRKGGKKPSPCWYIKGEVKNDKSTEEVVVRLLIGTHNVPVFADAPTNITTGGKLVKVLEAMPKLIHDNTDGVVDRAYSIYKAAKDGKKNSTLKYAEKYDRYFTTKVDKNGKTGLQVWEGYIADGILTAAD